ncbi:MAG: ATP-binding protein, partial [Candidatus Cloacimonadota bacterium]|nr:ATP-binding protein [Candidatus Cloacimonadota bacterium]
FVGSISAEIIELNNKKCLLTIVRDITEQKLSQEKLIKAQNYISNIMNSMPSALISVDKNGNVTNLNTKAEQIMNFNIEEAKGKSISKLIPRFSSILEDVKSTIIHKEKFFQANQHFSSNGKHNYEDITIYPLTADGVEGAVIRLDDVTEKNKMERRLIQSEKMMSIGGLAAGMAHEINNPLAGMVQNAQNIERRLINTKMKQNKQIAEEVGISLELVKEYMQRRNIFEMVDRIKLSGKKAAEIVSNMLAFSRNDKQQTSSQSIVKLVDNSIDLSGINYNVKKKFDFKNIKIIRDYESDLPNIDCNKGKIQQVFMNILKNGSEAMFEKKQVDVGKYHPKFIVRISQKIKNKMVRIEIEDNGPGMNKKTMNQIFEPFFTTKDPDLGTGLGLSLSFFIVTKDHLGEMYVESELGVGTKFIIELPIEIKII